MYVMYMVQSMEFQEDNKLLAGLIDIWIRSAGLSRKEKILK